jgi:Tol biopolymer transport system component
MNADGHNLRSLTKGPDWRNDWSQPKGERIVFLHWDFLEEVPGNGQLWIMDADGSNKRQLTFDGW